MCQMQNGEESEGPPGCPPSCDQIIYSIGLHSAVSGHLSEMQILSPHLTPTSGVFSDTNKQFSHSQWIPTMCPLALTQF